MEVGEEGDYILSLHCHHQKDSCIKMGFHVALRPRRRDGLLGTGTEWEGDERVKGSTAETVRKRPERQWTAARTMEVLRRCPLPLPSDLCTEQLLFQLLCWTESLRQCPLHCC